MIRMTEPMPCPRCRRPVVPGEERWYDEDAQPHVCEGAMTNTCWLHGQPIGPAPARNCPECRHQIDLTLAAPPIWRTPLITWRARRRLRHIDGQDA